MGKSITINGIDFTSYFTPWGYTCAYRKIQGGNQATMMDGTFLDDVRAYKITISAVCMPLTEEQTDTLIGTLYDPNFEYAIVRFYDPRTKGYREAECTFTTTPQKERGVGGDGLVRWTGLSVTFEGR